MNSDLELRRIEIVDGFAMPGFKGRYFMWPEEYWLLSKYVDMTSGSYLEVGSMCGIIAMSFAERYPHRQFVCVDKFSAGHGTIAGEKQTFLENQREHNLRNVTLCEGDSLAVVPNLSQSFDVILIDANHAYDYVLGDAVNSWRLLLPGGFIAFHDYGYVDETTRAVNEFLRQTEGGRFVESASSLAVIQKQASPMRMGLEKYVESHYQEQNHALKQELEKLQEDNDWLLSSIRSHEENCRQLEKLLADMQDSAGWRMLNRWRNIRNHLFGERTWLRKLYDSALRPLRGGSQ